MTMLRMLKETNDFTILECVAYVDLDQRRVEGSAGRPIYSLTRSDTVALFDDIVIKQGVHGKIACAVGSSKI
jgi:hypothetical protein